MISLLLSISRVFFYGSLWSDSNEFDFDLIVPTTVCVFLCTGEVGCSYCGGLGHRITDCPKLEAIQNKQAQNIGRKDYLASGAADW